MNSPRNRATDQPSIRISVFTSMLSLLGVLGMMVFTFMRDDDRELLEQNKALHAAQQITAIKLAEAVAKLDAAIIRNDRMARAVEVIQKDQYEVQRLAIAADERSRNNAERIRELRTN